MTLRSRVGTREVETEGSSARPCCLSVGQARVAALLSYFLILNLLFFFFLVPFFLVAFFIRNRPGQRATQLVRVLTRTEDAQQGASRAASGSSWTGETHIGPPATVAAPRGSGLRRPWRASAAARPPLCGLGARRVFLAQRPWRATSAARTQPRGLGRRRLPPQSPWRARASAGGCAMVVACHDLFASARLPFPCFFFVCAFIPFSFW